MSNPMLKNLNSPMSNLNQLKNLLRTVKNAGNPQMMLNQMMGQNPQLKQVMNFVNQNGGDPQKAFYELAKQKGVNPDEILKELNS